jgi:beta-galactosidase
MLGDFAGEESPTKWPATNSHFGIVDEAGYMKDDAFYYQAQFTKIPTAHIVPNEWEYLLRANA